MNEVGNAVNVLIVRVEAHNAHWRPGLGVAARHDEDGGLVWVIVSRNAR